MEERTEGQKTILFVDDEKSILSSLRRVFHDDPGLRVLTAENGEELPPQLADELLDLMRQAAKE